MRSRSYRELRVDSKTESFRRLYRTRAPVIEGIFAEAKQWHGLGRACRRGLTKMRVQCLLIAAVLNFKRLIAVFLTIFTPFPGESSIRIRLSIIRQIMESENNPSPRPILMTITPQRPVFQHAPPTYLCFFNSPSRGDCFILYDVPGRPPGPDLFGTRTSAVHD